MKAHTFLALFGVVVATCLTGYVRPAAADLRFCNQLPAASQVIEGHQTRKDGLMVRGVFPVASGRCGVIVPGRLTEPHYFLRILTPQGDYGGNSHLCIFDMMHFSIADEDARSFKCRGTAMPESFHIPGFKNMSEHLADFVTVFTTGHPTLIVTQRRDATIHFVVR